MPEIKFHLATLEPRFQYSQEGDDAAHFMRTQIMQGEYDKETKRVGSFHLRFAYLAFLVVIVLHTCFLTAIMFSLLSCSHNLTLPPSIKSSITPHAVIKVQPEHTTDSNASLTSVQEAATEVVIPAPPIRETSHGGVGDSGVRSP